MPCSAALRIVWMLLLIELSCCVSNWAELTALLWADERVRTRRQRLHRGREIVEQRVDPGRRARRAIDGLQLLVELGQLVGVGAARGLLPQLRLDQRVELAVDRRRANADRAAGRDRHLVERLADVARRLRVGDVAPTICSACCVTCSPASVVLSVPDKLMIHVRSQSSRALRADTRSSDDVQEILHHRGGRRDDLRVGRIGLLRHDQLAELVRDVGIRRLERAADDLAGRVLQRRPRVRRSPRRRRRRAA